ncbi:unnamed protein product, partial [Lampetra fluviatilis]
MPFEMPQCLKCLAGSQPSLGLASGAWGPDIQTASAVNNVQMDPVTGHGAVKGRIQQWIDAEAASREFASQDCIGHGLRRGQLGPGMSSTRRDGTSQGRARRQTN